MAESELHSEDRIVCTFPPLHSHERNGLACPTGMVITPDAIIDAAGGSAFVYGTSGCAVLAMYAAAAGLSPKMKKLALWESPYILDGSRPPVPQDYKEQLSKLLSLGRRGDMVELFMTKAVGMPA